MAERRSKYGAVQTAHEGRVFDSRLEADVARVLDLLVQQGRIRAYERQVRIELAPPRGRARAVTYVADFAVHGRHGSGLVEAKGYMTPAARLKLRWLAEKYPAMRLFVVRAPEEVMAVIEDLDRAAP